MGCASSKVADAPPDAKPLRQSDQKPVKGKRKSATKPATEEDLAASKLQSQVKGRSQRMQIEEQRKSAVKVQALYRGKKDRRFANQRRDELHLQREVKESSSAKVKKAQNRLQRVNDYAFVKMLGKGAYGQVYLAEYDPDTSVAAATAAGADSSINPIAVLNKAVGTASQIVTSAMDTTGVNKAVGTMSRFVGLSEKPPEVAIKVLSRSILKRKRVGRTGSAYDSVLGEIAVMKHLRHANIVRLYEVIDDPDQDLLFMCMELVTGGDLSEPITSKRAVPAAELRLWLRGLTLGLEHLHASGVCHRDIKPENLLWDPNTKQCKLSDFGISGFFRATSLGGDFFTATSGSLMFFAPEMCRSIKGAGYSGRAAALWACGVSLYMWLYHDSPYTSDNPPGLLKAIAEDAVVYPAKAPGAAEPPSAELLALLAGMLEKAPLQRSRVKELRRDAFITNNGAEPLEEPAEVVNARDGNVTVPKSELQSAIKRISIQSIQLKGAPSPQPGVDYTLDYELAAKLAESETVGEEEQEAVANLVLTREESRMSEGGPEPEGAPEAEPEGAPEAEPEAAPPPAAPPPAAAEGV